MVSTIGSATTNKNVLENPDHISKHVLSKGLDAGTAYEILSIDIADVLDVGENIGAKLQIDQANADSKSPRPRRRSAVPWPWHWSRKCGRAWSRRRCRVPWPRPSARGIWGIMDYYRMKNVQADRTMRDAIGRGGEDSTVSGKR